jgi:sigma-B regulation protein RsbU (phosphoserine phosphatase)
MVATIEPVLREQLADRRQKLTNAIGTSLQDSQLINLLHEVDAAIERIEMGAYGLCDACHEPIEAERLIADPLVRFCLGDLTVLQQRALEEDLQLAARIQKELLPRADLRIDGWQVSHHYEPAGPVSGDYCDLIRTGDGGFYFVLGDVSGKGVAAAMLMNQLHAMFRSLVSFDLPLQQLVERASRVFCESTLPTHFATLVCGKADTAGQVEICNAGHLPPLLIQEGGVTCIDSTGLPLGVFSSEEFTIARVQLSPGDTLLLYTDGLTESQDGSGIEFGSDRLSNLAGEHRSATPELLIRRCVENLDLFRSRDASRDDLTIMAVRRQPVQ